MEFETEVFRLNLQETFWKCFFAVKENEPRRRCQKLQFQFFFTGLFDLAVLKHKTENLGEVIAAARDKLCKMVLECTSLV